MSSAGFEPEIPANERPKINDLDCETIGIGISLYRHLIFFRAVKLTKDFYVY